MDSLRTLRTLGEELVICRRIAALRLRGQMEYRTSFLMQIGGTLLGQATELAALVILFHRFGSLGGWNVGEVIFLHAVSQIVFSLADTISNGVQTIPTTIREGEFDRLMIRPVSTWLQAMVNDVSLRHLGMLIQGSILMGWALWAVPIDWTPGKVALLLVSIVSGVALFTAIFTIEAIVAFWTVNSIEAVNAFTYGGSDLAQYPFHIFGRGIRFIFLWIVPIGFVVYYPALTILDKPDPLGLPGIAPLMAPLMAALFCGAVGLLWTIGVRHYRSTGS
ncbi:MAG: ABC transporter permease [Thermomicrobiales bacterium]